MNGEEFLAASSEMSRYIVNYLENIRERRVLPNVQPGYMKDLLPDRAPETSEKFEDIMKDIERVIMPGVTHWQSPRFNAYFPAADSYPAIVADMLCQGVGCIGFTWISSPACTELEFLMMDWLGQLIGLPKEFLAKNETNGCGGIQSSASEATLITFLAAKKKALTKLSEQSSKENMLLSLVAYTSDQSHCSVERAAMMSDIKLRLLPTDEKCSLRGNTLKKAVQEDIEKGLIPFYVVATLGTTNSCAFDNLREIGEVAKEYGLWTHVDAAYAGSALVCEEYHYLMDGIELMDSFNFSPQKWLLVNIDCSAMWVKDSRDIVDAFNVDPLCLKHKYQGKVRDYRNWQISLGRRFRSLKLWFVMRMYGKSGLQEYIRKHIALAKEFEGFVQKDPRFEIIGEVVLGLVCFRLKGTNEINEKLINDINDAGIIYMVPSKIKENYFLRYAVCSLYTESSDVLISWKEVQKHANNLLTSEEK